MRSEVELRLAGEVITLRPTYRALLAAEEELGSLFALIERSSEGGLTIRELATLLWHCQDPQQISREPFAQACVSAGLAQITPIYRRLIEIVLAGASG